MDHAAAQCSLGDTRACEDLEFEGGAGRAPAGRAAAAWRLPPANELAVTLLLPLLLALLSGAVRGRRRGRPARRASSGPAPAAATSPLSPAAASQATAASPDALASPPAHLPPHPGAAAGHAAAGGGLSMGAAVDAAASLLLLPLSVVQAALSGLRDPTAAAAAAPATPAPGPSPGGGSQPGTCGGGRGHYGLGYGEAESEEDEWGAEGGESELTAAAVRRLQASAEYRRFLKARGLTPADVANSTRRLRLYRHLRRLDPQAFWQLLRPGSRTAFESRAPSRLLLASEYMLSSAANVAVAAALYCLATGQAIALPAAAKAAAVALAWAAATQWLRGRPTAGALFGVWYEEQQWGHGAPAWRCLAASLAETAYIVGSAGLGLGVSLALRCGRRQGLGELLAGVAAVQEVQLTAAAAGEG